MNFHPLSNIMCLSDHFFTPTSLSFLPSNYYINFLIVFTIDYLFYYYYHYNYLGTTINTTMIVLQNNIRDIINNNYIKYIDKYNSSSGSVGITASNSTSTTNGSIINSKGSGSSSNIDDVIKAVSYRIRLELSTLLLPLYQSIVYMLVNSQQELFNRQLTRLPSTSQLPKQLQILSTKALKSMNTNLQLLRTGIYDVS